MSEPERHSGEPIAFQRVDSLLPMEVVVTCPSREPDGRLADRHSAYFDNVSPALRWTTLPDVRAWALVVEDPDAPRDLPFVHWMAWNIPGSARGLPEAIGNLARPVRPAAMVQGRNDQGVYGWFGPRPPAGHGLHHYHFQLFALSEAIDIDADAPFKGLLRALKARTLAKGEMTATYEAPRRQ